MTEPIPSASPSGSSVSEMLARPVQYLPGAGPRRAEQLERLGIRTVRDVLFHFPRTYEELQRPGPLNGLVAGQSASVVAEVEEAELRESGARSVLGVLFRGAGGGHLRAVWFNQPWLAPRFRRGQRLLVTGTPRVRGLVWEMSHPRVQWLAADEHPSGQVLPVYPLTEGVRQSHLRKLTSAAVERYADTLEEVLPERLRARRKLVSIGSALRGIHTPESRADVAAAQSRLIYQELLVLQLALALRSWRLGAQRPATPLPATAKIDARIRRLFPFQLTDDQNRAIAEMTADLGRSFPMSRLLQGDVGTGKTVVAMYAMLLAVAHQRQAVLMAPTEVLARQHARTLARSLRASRVRIEVLTGSLGAEPRRELLRAVQAGEVDVIVGTQALINAVAQHELEFSKLALVIVDEQHKFGVQQRATLRGAGADPHYLVMTATPIPRTMALTLFGDLEVSQLRQAPPGRHDVHTYLVDESDRPRWWSFFCRKLREGRQGFVVTPTVEEQPGQELRSATEAFEALSNGVLADFRVDLLHGRMVPEEKDQAMRRFEEGETQVLVATSVVEVGIDVPNATVMTIEGAERFGLAQLHQLRGRIRRGGFPGYVGVFADGKTELAAQRLDAFARTSDGFELAELDFQLRGPGDLFGQQQHGLPPLRIADLQRDAAALEEARDDARQLLAADPGLQREEHQRLKQMVLRRYGESLEISRE